MPAVRGEAPALLPGSPAGGAEAPGPVEHGQVSALRRGAQGGEVSGWCFCVELGCCSPDLGWRWSQSPPVALRGPAVPDGCLLAQVRWPPATLCQLRVQGSASGQRGRAAARTGCSDALEINPGASPVVTGWCTQPGGWPYCEDLHKLLSIQSSCLPACPWTSRGLGPWAA